MYLIIDSNEFVIFKPCNIYVVISFNKASCSFFVTRKFFQFHEVPGVHGVQTTQFNGDVLYESQIYINNNLSNGAQDYQGSRKAIVSLFNEVQYDLILSGSLETIKHQAALEPLLEF